MTGSIGVAQWQSDPLQKGRRGFDSYRPCHIPFGIMEAKTMASTISTCSCGLAMIRAGRVSICDHCDFPCPNFKDCAYCDRMKVQR